MFQASSEKIMLLIYLNNADMERKLMWGLHTMTSSIAAIPIIQPNI